MECDHVRRRFKGANLYAHHNDGHRWMYLGNQQPDEVLLMKMFDSQAVPAKREQPLPVLWYTVSNTNQMTGLAHASFRHPCATEHSRSRKSIEVRALIFNHLGLGGVSE